MKVSPSTEIQYTLFISNENLKQVIELKTFQENDNDFINCIYDIKLNRRFVCKRSLNSHLKCF
jgi:hypothetical protein